MTAKPSRSRSLVAAIALLILAAVTPAASAQPPTPGPVMLCDPLVAIDTPAPDATIRGDLTVSGWALDAQAPSGSGIEEIHVYLDGAPGTGTLLGGAKVGLPRPDVDAAYGRQGSNPGWRLAITDPSAELGGHQLSIYARTRCGWSATTRTFNVAPAEGWALLNPPPGRSAHGVAWDTTRNQLYALGGRGGGTHADLWVYRPDRNAWSPVQPAGTVPRLNAHALVWDPTGDRLLIFGGYGADRSDGLWAYSPGDNRIEALVPDGPRPAGRGYHSAVWTGDRILVFGGVGGRFDFFDDLWSYDPRANSWSQLRVPAPGPTPRFYHSAAWDPEREQMLVFGGVDAYIGILDDFWSYDPATNSWTELWPDGPQPPSRLSASMIWDPGASRVLLYGGGCGGCYRDDLWSYDPAAGVWEALEPAGARPKPRGGQGAVWDAPGRQMLIFAGGESLNDLWSYRPGGNRWARLAPTVTLLPALGGARAVWDPAAGRMLLFGGDTGAADPGRLDLVRVYRSAGHAWEEIPTVAGPTVRTGHTVVWDEGRGQALLFGGRRDDGSVSGELWSYAPTEGRWMRLGEGGAGPVARAFHSAIWDPRGEQLLIYGGAGASGAALEDLWSYRPATGTWSQIAAIGPIPRARVRHSAVWDARSNEMLVYGGYRDQEGYTSEVWSFSPDQGRWTPRTATGGEPPARSRHSAVWDPADGRMLVFGGYTGGVDYLGDLWAYDSAHGAWTLLSAQVTPLPRADHMAVWDPGAKEMLIFGGGAGDPSNELWSYRMPASALPGPATPTPGPATPGALAPGSPTRGVASPGTPTAGPASPAPTPTR